MMNLNPESVSTITIQAAGTEKLEGLIQDLLAEQKKANHLLTQIVEKVTVKEMMDHKETAEFLGISPATLYNRVSEGKIPQYKNGTKSLYKRSDLEAILETQRVRKVPAGGMESKS